MLNRTFCNKLIKNDNMSFWNQIWKLDTNWILFIWQWTSKHTRPSSLLRFLASSRVEEIRGGRDGLSYIMIDVNLKSQTWKHVVHVLSSWWSSVIWQVVFYNIEPLLVGFVVWVFLNWSRPSWTWQALSFSSKYTSWTAPLIKAADQLTNAQLTSRYKNLEKPFRLLSPSMPCPRHDR